MNWNLDPVLWNAIKEKIGRSNNITTIRTIAQQLVGFVDDLIKKNDSQDVLLTKHTHAIDEKQAKIDGLITELKRLGDSVDESIVYNNPADYVNNIIDTIDMQKEQIKKSNAKDDERKYKTSDGHSLINSNSIVYAKNPDGSIVKVSSWQITHCIEDKNTKHYHPITNVYYSEQRAKST